MKSISAGSFAGKSPKQCYKLSNLVADRTGIVDNEVVVVEYLAKKHKSIMKQLLLSSQLGMQRSGELREFTLCLQTESRASVQLFRRDMVISTKRAASDATLEKKAQKKQTKAETLADRKGEIMLKVNQAKET